MTLIRYLKSEAGGGFTVIELLVAIAILGTLAGIAIPSYSSYIDKARITKAIAEISILQKEIKIHELLKRALPDTLDDINRGNLLDPYGRPYQYFDITSYKSKEKESKEEKSKEEKSLGKPRKDQWDKPLNFDFDLYSMGKDGKTNANLQANFAHDDIIRAADGRFIGLASEY